MRERGERVVECCVERVVEALSLSLYTPSLHSLYTPSLHSLSTLPLDTLHLQAVQHGHWLVLENIDAAPPDALAALTPLCDAGVLHIPQRSESIPAAPGFQLMATLSTSAGRCCACGCGGVYVGVGVYVSVL